MLDISKVGISKLKILSTLYLGEYGVGEMIGWTERLTVRLKTKKEKKNHPFLRLYRKRQTALPTFLFPANLHYLPFPSAYRHFLYMLANTSYQSILMKDFSLNIGNWHSPGDSKTPGNQCRPHSVRRDAEGSGEVTIFPLSLPLPPTLEFSFPRGFQGKCPSYFEVLANAVCFSFRGGITNNQIGETTCDLQQVPDVNLGLHLGV